ncbi:hypothetical protein [Kitasatospora viridis]|uniref:Uncharacterized protein n=1 Tax=Kitasatospora viridis TaxID=281105 RepID=A0A561UI52_9ACTN|nr:hypothetical protein [Kitasatospora viridis]TWF99036.1 hypothetical protein FHX73_112872 [Kitasatospora viridis]
MNFRNHKALLALLMVLIGLLPVLVGRLVGGNIWLWTGFGAALAAAVPVLLARMAGAAPLADPFDGGLYGGGSPGEEFAAAPPSQESYSPPPEQPFREVKLERVPLPSLNPEYDFLVSMTVWWRPVRNVGAAPHVNPRALAVDWMIARAKSITEGEQPRRCDLVQRRLEGALGSQALDGSARVEAGAGNISLTLASVDQEHLEHLAKIRRAVESWDAERRHEKNRRSYLGDDVLKSPGSAVVWWLSRQAERGDHLDVEKVVELIGPLAELAAAANNSPVPEAFRHLVRDVSEGADDPDLVDELREAVRQGLIEGFYEAAVNRPAPAGEPAAADPTGDPLRDSLDEFLEELGLQPDSDARRVAAHRLADLAEHVGKTDAAARIRGWDGGPEEEPPPAPVATGPSAPTGRVWQAGPSGPAEEVEVEWPLAAPQAPEDGPEGGGSWSTAD